VLPSPAVDIDRRSLLHTHHARTGTGALISRSRAVRAEKKSEKEHLGNPPSFHPRFAARPLVTFAPLISATIARGLTCRVAARYPQRSDDPWAAHLHGTAARQETLHRGRGRGWGRCARHKPHEFYAEARSPYIFPTIRAAARHSSASLKPVNGVQTEAPGQHQ
jgi:hypothetical protein